MVLSVLAASPSYSLAASLDRRLFAPTVSFLDMTITTAHSYQGRVLCCRKTLRSNLSLSDPETTVGRPGDSRGEKRPLLFSAFTIFLTPVFICRRSFTSILLGASSSFLTYLLNLLFRSVFALTFFHVALFAIFFPADGRRLVSALSDSYPNAARLMNAPSRLRTSFSIAPRSDPYANLSRK